MLPIETERLRLRRLEPRDAAPLAQYRSEPDVARYQSWESLTLAEAQDFILEQPADLLADAGRWYQLAIADNETDALLGDIGICIHPLGDVAEIGFTVATAAQGRGVAAEACRLAIALIFQATHVTAIEAVIDSRNAPAIALAGRLGMSLGGAATAEFKGESCTEYRFVLPRR